MTSGMTTVVAISHWKFSFISIMLGVGFATEIFLEIAFLNSVKMANRPVVPKAVCNAIVVESSDLLVDPGHHMFLLMTHDEVMGTTQ